MKNVALVKRQVARLGSLGFAVMISLIGGGLSATPAAAQACVGTVAPPAGKVCGLPIVAPSETTRALYSYRGIPYARPPVADLRWAPPEPHPRWRNVRPATSFGAICPQDGTTDDSEDCLFLNIWTAARGRRAEPAAAGHGLLPRRLLRLRRRLPPGL